MSLDKSLKKASALGGKRNVLTRAERLAALQEDEKWKPEAGVYKAFNKTCSHQGCPVTDIEDSDIVCRCHGARFSIADGSVTNGPAQKPLAEVPVTLEGTDLRITPQR